MKNIPIILGPTGAGKTDLVHRIALQLGAEVISADSRALYKRLDIGTATPTEKKRNEVTYHLVNSVSPRSFYSAMDFRRGVEEKVGSIISGGNLPVLAGGSRLYVKALTEGIFEGPGADEELRDRLRKKESNELHERLESVDSPSAEKIHPNDKKRIVRALEVYELTGRPISKLQEETEPLPYDFLLIGLKKPRERLYDDIDSRVEEMFQRGLVGEVKGLLEDGFCEDWGAWETIGYKEVVKFLEGELTLDEAKQKIKNNTHRLARKQLGWLDKEDLCWINVETDEEKAYEKLLDLVGEKCLPD